MSEETIAALISSLFPILITLFIAWIGSRNEQSKRARIMEDARQRIELINAYITSQNLVIDDPRELESIKKTAARELLDIKTFLDDKLQSMKKSSEKSESYFQRFFLLYPMRTGLARFFRVCFFIALPFSIIWSILFSSAIISGNVVETSLSVSIISLSILVLPAVIGVLVLRWLAIKFDKPERSMVTTELAQ